VLTQACQGIETASFEFPLMTAKGKCIDILLNATPRRNEKGVVTGVVGVGQDITLLREAMNETSRVADDLTRLIDTANAPIFGIDIAGRVTVWNQKAAALSGWKEEEAVGKPLVESFIPADYREEVDRVLTMALAGTETANYEFPLFTKDNRRRDILLNATTRRGADGSITGVIGVGQDITELQSITADKARIADDLSRLIETANAPIFGVNVEGRVTEWNRKAAELSGHSTEETMDRPLVEDFISPENKEKVQAVLTQACNGVETANFEFPLVTKSGAHIDILLNATTRTDAHGNINGVVGVGQDITILRQAMNETTRVADDLTRLIDTANAPIFGVDRDGRVTEWNQKAAALSGWSKQETLGKPLVESFISSDYREEVNRVLAMALSGHETANYEFPLFTKITVDEKSCSMRRHAVVPMAISLVLLASGKILQSCGLSQLISTELLMICLG
jgi:PAS domain S-box-containing protein